MSTEPESVILQLLGDMRAETGGHARRDQRYSLRNGDQERPPFRTHVAARGRRRDFIDVRREIGQVRKDLSEQIVGLRRAVVEYHTSVIGHGVIISELEARLRRVEQRLDLAGPDAH